MAPSDERLNTGGAPAGFAQKVGSTTSGLTAELILRALHRRSTANSSASARSPCHHPHHACFFFFFFFVNKPPAVRRSICRGRGLRRADRLRRVGIVGDRAELACHRRARRISPVCTCVFFFYYENLALNERFLKASDDADARPSKPRRASARHANTSCQCKTERPAQDFSRTSS